ncbi:MAG: CotH kinase family protein, partial [bacterium]
MRIKNLNKQDMIFSNMISFLLRLLKKDKIFIGFVLLGLYSGGLLIVGVLAQRAGYSKALKIIVLQNYKVVLNYFNGLMSHPEKITIDMKYKHYQKLAYQREIALANGKLIPSSDEYVPATIRYRDRSIKVKLRLKGRLSDHWQDENKWSFKVKVKGDNTILGMKTFSLQHPRTRKYFNEVIFFKLLEFSGLISLRYDFVEVILNGKSLGIYAMQEHFEKRLIEHNNYREGPIVKLSDFYFLSNIRPELDSREYVRNVLRDSYSLSPLVAFNLKQVEQNDILRKNYITAINLFESFRQGKLMTSQVFNVKKLAKLFAIKDLCGSWEHHSIQITNIRFYYNPITSLLEPIGQDNTFIEDLIKEGLVGSLGTRYLTAGNGELNWFISFFHDKLFYSEYIKALAEVSERSFLDKFFNENKDEIREKLNKLHRGFPLYIFDKMPILYKNQEYIKRILNPPQGVQANFNRYDPNNNSIIVEVANIQSMPLEILNISYKDSILFQLNEEILLSGKILYKLAKYQNVRFTLPKDMAWSDSMITELKVIYKLLGTSQIRYETILPRSHLDKNFFENDLIRQKPNIYRFEFLVTNESEKRILIKPGIWNLDKNLIIPKDYRVICPEGTHLNLSNSAKILSYSPLEFIGSEDYPIVIQSTDSTGQGIIVMNANETSVLEYVTFNNLSSPSQSGWELTGAVTFYESPVNISHCQFIGNRSEDGL